MKTNILDEQLEALRQHLDRQLSSEANRLNEGLRQKAATNIAAIKSRAEASIRNAVARYEAEMAEADVVAQNPSLSPPLAESMRKSAKRMLEVTINAHKTVADNAIRSIQNLMK